MPNANNAKLVRIATRALGSHIVTTTPLASGISAFEVVVEASAGSVLGASAQPYSLAISALDLTTGTNPHSAANNFSQQRLERFDAAHGWPNKAATFTITLNALMAVQGHLFRYYATLTSPNQIVSFVESPLFLLYLYRAEFGIARGPVDTTINRVAVLPMEDMHERE
jgi:hypothetical protein